MNAYDSARMADVLAPLGYGPADTAETADVVILNTCHIREHASEKVFSELGRLRRLKQERAQRGESLLIAVAGCVAQAEGEALLARAPFVDIVLGPQTYDRLPEMVARVARSGGRVLDTDFPEIPKFDRLPAPSVQGASAFLAVQEGCDKFCAYCVVPYTRGGEYSRPVAGVLAEAERLCAEGVREITLLGQNVNAYHGEGPDGGTWSLARLIERLACLPGLDRIRYTTSHPLDMADDLIAAHRDIPALMPFLHLPVQSGSNRVLKAMGRHHSIAGYRRIIDKLRQARSDLALSSDFIVGFPGESDADFEDSLNLVKEIGFAQAYSFKYSPRPGTPAAALTEQLPESIKEERLARLQAAITAQSLAFNRSCLGSEIDVLLERPGRKAGQLAGRSPYMQAVFVQAPEPLSNSIQRLTVIGASANSLAAVLAERREGAA